MYAGLLQQTNVEGDKVAFSGIDWLTLTWETAKVTEPMEVVKQLERKLIRGGAISKSWRTQHAYGRACGPLKRGILRANKHKSILTISGPLSQMLAVSVTPEIKATRLDVCVDVFSFEPDFSIRESMEKRHKATDESGQPLDDTVFFSSKTGGWTLYHGNGGRGMKLRVYDKGAQKEARPGLWTRWELQVGRDFAHRARYAMNESECIVNWIAGVVNKYCRHRGIPVPADEDNREAWIASCWVGDVEDEGDKMQAWLRSVVVPFTKRYRGYFGDEELLRELGLGSYWDVARLYENDKDFDFNLKNGINQGKLL